MVYAPSILALRVGGPGLIRCGEIGNMRDLKRGHKARTWGNL